MVPSLPGTIYVEPGKLCESGMSSIDDAPDTSNGVFLDISVFGLFSTLNAVSRAFVWRPHKPHLP